MVGQWERQWRPTNCHTRYAQLYVFASECVKSEETPVETPPPVETPVETEPPSPWCPACMRPSVETYTLNCGHSFCKRCLANLHYPLMEHYYFTVIRPRPDVTVHCPVPSCKEKLLCLPFVNGDFRFNEIRDTDKCPHIPKLKERDTPQILKELQDYRIRVDIDLCSSESHSRACYLPIKVLEPKPNDDGNHDDDESDIF